VERWFGYLTDQKIRRGVHKSVQALEAATARYPAQCVMLQTMPGGHCGAPRSPDRRGVGFTPRAASAVRAQAWL
jgi:hypothetical protein